MGRLESCSKMLSSKNTHENLINELNFMMPSISSKLTPEKPILLVFTFISTQKDCKQMIAIWIVVSSKNQCKDLRKKSRLDAVQQWDHLLIWERKV